MFTNGFVFVDVKDISKIIRSCELSYL